MKLLEFLYSRTVQTCCILSLASPFSAHATTVQVQTTAGDFVINLFDFDPAVQATAENFIAYVENGSYDNTFFHRLSRGFVLQGGGYVYNDPFPAPQDTDLNLEEVVRNPGQANPTVPNQPKYSNVIGTVTMAKIGGDPDSATNQWFINLANNGSNLDIQNGGFTVFGQVTSGMDVVASLANFNLLAEPMTPEPGVEYTYASPLTELPLQNYNNDNFAANDVPDNTNLAIINAVVILDPTQDTASGLNIVRNELILPGVRATPIVIPQDFKDGGGVGLLFLALLSGLLYLRRRF
jgi:cyclophilin family peptidyl-prolyl cis-trans isomerase